MTTQMLALIAATERLLEPARPRDFRFTPGTIAAAEKAIADARRAMGIRPRAIGIDDPAVRDVLCRIGPPSDSYPAA